MGITAAPHAAERSTQSCENVQRSFIRTQTRNTPNFAPQISRQKLGTVPMWHYTIVAQQEEEVNTEVSKSAKETPHSKWRETVTGPHAGCTMPFTKPRKCRCCLNRWEGRMAQWDPWVWLRWFASTRVCQSSLMLLILFNNTLANGLIKK